MKRTDIPSTVEQEVPPAWRDVVTMRVLKAKYGKSKAGNRMITLECEIAAPAQVNWQDKEYIIEGLKHSYWLVLESKTSTGKGAAPISKVFKFHDAVGIDSEEINENDPDLSVYNGLHFRTVLTSIPETVQRKGADGKYENVTEDGQPIMKGWTFIGGIEDVIGQAAPVESVKMPY